MTAGKAHEGPSEVPPRAMREEPPKHCDDASSTPPSGHQKPDGVGFMPAEENSPVSSAPSYGFEVLQVSFLLMTFGLAYLFCGILGFTYGSTEYARVLFTLFVGFNISSVYIAMQGLRQIPPRSMLRESMVNMTTALACAAAANSTDLILWIIDAAMFKATILPNLFFVSAIIFGIAGIYQMARICRVVPGIDSAMTFFIIVITYIAIPFVIDSNIFSQCISMPPKKEVLFGLFYAFAIGYMTAVTLKIWRDAQGSIRSAVRLICLGTLFLSLGCSIYGPLFANNSALQVTSHWIHVLLALGYFTVGLGIQRMGITVVAIFSPDIEPLSTAQPLLDIFGPVLGMRVYEAMAKRIREPHEALIRIETENQLRKQRIQELEQAVRKATEAEETLKSAKEEAEAANLSKSHFFALISHELRTPLTAILAHGQLLGDSSGPISKSTNPEIQELGMNIRKNAGHLQNLIDGILQFSRFDAGRTTPEIKHFLLRELLDFVVPLAELQVQGKDIRFILDAPGEPVSIYADQQYLRQILLNLLLNAFKFTGSGSVTLRLSINRSSLLVSVIDTGIGIPADQIDSIIEPFFQVSGGSTRKSGGTGLGLAIVKRLVNSMNGTLHIESKIDHGTRVDVILHDIILVNRQ